MNTAEFFGLACSLFFAFFFSCFEFAYQMANKSQLDKAISLPGFPYKILQFLIQKPARLLGTTRVGYCASLVFFSYFAAKLFLSTGNIVSLPFYRIVVDILFQIILSVLLIISTAQFLSKTAANVNPYRLLIFAAVPFGFLFIILWIFTYPIISISKLIIVHLLRIPYRDTNPVYGLIDINQYFQTIYHVNHEDANLQVDEKILHNALEFKTVKIRECMIPRNEITAVEITDSIETLQRTFLESGHSKIIIYRNTID
jgi:putative hemolysin